MSVSDVLKVHATSIYLSVHIASQVVKSNGVVLDGAYEGASIAINGVCTTVVVFDEETFKV